MRNISVDEERKTLNYLLCAFEKGHCLKKKDALALFDLLVKFGYYDKAQEFFDYILRRFRDELDNSKLAEMCMRANMIDRVEEFLRPSNISSCRDYFQYGNMLFLKGLTEEALRYFIEARKFSCSDVHPAIFRMIQKCDYIIEKNRFKETNYHVLRENGEDVMPGDVILISNYLNGHGVVSDKFDTGFKRYVVYKIKPNDKIVAFPAVLDGGVQKYGEKFLVFSKKCIHTVVDHINEDGMNAILYRLYTKNMIFRKKKKLNEATCDFMNEYAKRYELKIGDIFSIIDFNGGVRLYMLMDENTICEVIKENNQYVLGDEEFIERINCIYSVLKLDPRINKALYENGVANIK